MRHSRYSTVMRLLLALVVLAGFIYWAADTHDRIEVGLYLGQHSRDPFKIDADTGKIASLMPEARLAGLVTDATIKSINGVPCNGFAQWAAISNPGKPGELVFVDFQRPDGSIGSSLITLVAGQPQPGAAAADSVVRRPATISPRTSIRCKSCLRTLNQSNLSPPNSDHLRRG